MHLHEFAFDCNHLHFHTVDDDDDDDVKIPDGVAAPAAAVHVAALMLEDLHDDLVTNCMDPLAYCVAAVVAVDHTRTEPLELAAVAVAAAAAAAVVVVVVAVAVAVAAVADPCDAFAFDDFVEHFDDELATLDCVSLAYSYYCNRFDLDLVAICMHWKVEGCTIAVDMAMIVVA